MLKLKLLSCLFILGAFFSCSVEEEQNEIEPLNEESDLLELDYKVRIRAPKRPDIVNNCPGCLETIISGSKIIIDVQDISSWKASEINIYIKSNGRLINVEKNFKIKSLKQFSEIIIIPNSTPSGTYQFYVENSINPNENRYGDYFNVINNSDTTPLYRYYAQINGDHFYTTNFNELGSGSSWYKLEGVACKIFKKSIQNFTTPLYRYVNSKTGDHFYTINFRELDNGSLGYKLEGISGHVFNTKIRNSLPLYRYYNPTNGDHFYTTNFNELGNGRLGYLSEGIQCYVLSE